MKRKTVQTKYDVPVRRAFRWASEQQSCSAEASMIVRNPAPWLTKEIIFVCTVFLSFTLRMTCGRTLIHARSTLWTAPQSLRFTLWNSGYWMSAYKERWRQNAVEFKWHSFKRLSHYLKCSPPQIVKETIGVGVNEKAVLRFYQTALSITSISIFPWWTKSRPFRHHLWEFNLCSLL